MNDLYHEELLEAARAPRHKGALSIATISSPPLSNSCGDSCRVYLALSHDKKKVLQASWEGTGCAISMASSSVLFDHLQGVPIASVQTWQESTLLEWLGLENFSAARSKCLLLGLNAVQKLLQDT